MKIVAFLQCPSHVLKREEVDRYKTDQQFHQEQLRKTMSGARLHVAFGHDMFRDIWWDNAIPRPADQNENADIKHIDKVLIEQDPDIILAFGRVAYNGVMDSVAAIRRKVFKCHHPNARFKFQADLDQFAAEVRAYIFDAERTLEEEEVVEDES